MSMRWLDVFVPTHVVASDGFEAQVGGVVAMPLSLFCRYRTAATEADRDTPIRSTAGAYSHPDYCRVYDLVGSAVGVDGCAWLDGWILDMDGLAIYVSEADDVPEPGRPTFNVYREAGSDPALPIPRPGTRVRLRGQLAIAEAHETGGYEPQDALLRRPVRSWQVRRIVRLDGVAGEPGPPYRGRNEEVTQIRYDDLRYQGRWRTTGYLLDLEHPVEPVDPGS